jgi:hypothetical protein
MWATDMRSIQQDKDVTFLKIYPQFFGPANIAITAMLAVLTSIPQLHKLNVHWHIAGDLSICYTKWVEAGGKIYIYNFLPPVLHLHHMLYTVGKYREWPDIATWQHSSDQRCQINHVSPLTVMNTCRNKLHYIFNVTQ